MAKKNDALIRRALETALPEKRDVIEATLKRAIKLEVDESCGLPMLLIVTQNGENFHSIMYPCDISGANVNWERDSYFCENGKTMDGAIAEVRDAVLNVDKTDYPPNAEVLVKSGRMEFVGLKGRIFEILGKDEPQRVFGHRYHVRFYDDKSDFGLGYVAASSFRQSQLELISKPQEASNGN